MTKIKKGDKVELRSDITSFMTLKLIGEVKSITKDGRYVVVSDTGEKLGTFSKHEIEKR